MGKILLENRREFLWRARVIPVWICVPHFLIEFHRSPRRPECSSAQSQAYSLSLLVRTTLWSVSDAHIFTSYCTKLYIFLFPDYCLFMFLSLTSVVFWLPFFICASEWRSIPFATVTTWRSRMLLFIPSQQ